MWGEERYVNYFEILGKKSVSIFCLNNYLNKFSYFEGVLDIPMISWVVMLVSRLLDYVATVEDEAATSKKPLNGKERERFLTGVVYTT